MQTGTSPVKIREKNPDGTAKEVQVNTATFAIYETVAEAEAALGEEQLLNLLNTQVKTNELNRVRELARNGPGKKALEREAMDWIGEHFDEVKDQIAGVPGGLIAVRDKKVAELLAERKAAAPAVVEDNGNES